MSDGAILVIGGAGGIGDATIAVLRAQGRRVAATVLGEDQHEALATRHGAGVTTSLLDLADIEAIGPRIDALVRALDAPLAAVVIAAAMPCYGPLEIVPLAAMRHLLDVNIVSNLAIYQATLRFLQETSGRLVIVSSNSATCPIPFIGPYVVSKHGLRGLIDVMRQEARLSGVAVIDVEPGLINTTMVSRQQETLAVDRAHLSPEIEARYGGYYRRFSDALDSAALTGLDPAEVAAVIFAAIEADKPESRYVVGPRPDGLAPVWSNAQDAARDAMLRQVMFG